MSRALRGLAGLLVVIVLLSVSAAAAANPGSGYEIVADAPVEILGPARAELPGGIVHVRAESSIHDFLFTLNASSLRITEYEEGACGDYGTPSSCVPTEAPVLMTREHVIQNATLTVTQMRDRFDAAIRGGTLSAAAAKESDSSSLTPVLAASRLESPRDSRGNDVYTSAIPASGFAYRSEATRLSGAGDFEIYLMNATVKVEGDRNGSRFTRTFDLHDTRSASSVGGLTAWHSGGLRFLVLAAEGGALEVDFPLPLRARSEEPVVHASKSVRFLNATGSVSRAFLQGTDVTLTGSFEVRPLERVQDGHRMRVLVIGEPAFLDSPLTKLSSDEPLLENLGTALAAAAGAGGFALLGAILYYWPRIRFFLSALLIPMYTRISKHEMLEHGTRETIYGLIRENPGIHAHEISAKSRIGWGTAVHHLRMMESANLIVSRRAGRYKRFFMSAGIAPDKKQAYGVLRNDTTKRIATFVAANAGCIQKDVCAQFGLTPSLVSWHMGKLEEAGLVKKIRDGRKVHYYAGPAWNDIHGAGRVLEEGLQAA